MSYAHAIGIVKNLDINKPYNIKKYINENYEPDLQEKICAKWYVMTIKNMSYIEKPSTPMDYINLKATQKMGGNIKHYMDNPQIQKYIKTKQKIELQNHNDFMRLKWCYKALDESEKKAQEFIKDKIYDYLVRASNDDIAFIYDFSNDKIKQEIF